MYWAGNDKIEENKREEEKERKKDWDYSGGEEKCRTPIYSS